MVRGILAEGRFEDASRMMEPLLRECAEGSDFDPGTATLRCLMARVGLLHRGDHERAFGLLEPYLASGARTRLDPSVHAEVALWLAWVSVWRDDHLYDEARALNLLDVAEQTFQEEMNPSGRCWALLGQAQAYFTIDEYRLMLQALEEARGLLEKLGDRPAETWWNHLAAFGARFEGRYRAALRYADTLESVAETTRDELARGRALAHKAVLALETGKHPSDIVDLARRSEQLLSRSGVYPTYALCTAYHAHAGVLIRQGSWREAEQMLSEAIHDLRDLATAPVYLTLQLATVACRRGDVDEARAILSEIEGQVRRHHHLLHSSIESVHCECDLSDGRPKDAASHAELALRYAREGGHDGAQLSAVLLKARTALAAGDSDAARAHMREAETHADYFSLLPYAAERFFIIGSLARGRERFDEARASLTQALSAYSLVGDLHKTALAQLELARATRPAREALPLAQAALDTFDQLGARRDAAEARRLLDEIVVDSAETVAGAETDIGAILARSAFSVELVAESWLQAAEELAPNRWLVVHRYDENAWTLVHAHGEVPGDLTMPDPSAERVCEEGVDWMRLRGLPAPAFFFGMECGGDDDPACGVIEKKLLPWIPVVGLALEHALLRAVRLGNEGTNAHATETPLELEDFVYASAGMRHVAHQIKRVRSGHSPVLISGERGVGKSVVARAIHDSGDRQNAPFVPVRCSGISADVVEAELFGGPGRAGALRDAHRGTLYLEDIDALPERLQPRLLRLLEDGTVGEDGEPAQLDVRVIASTREDLRTHVRAGHFLEELYYRLSLVPIRVPPLRERREEIPLLVHHFLKDLTQGRSAAASVTSRALDTLIRYGWPGNVRQLRNEIERLLVFAATEPVSTIDVDDLSDSIRAASADRAMSMDANGSLDGVTLNGRGLDEILANAERSVIEQILARHDGQVSATADALGLSRQGLYKKMKRLGIDASTAVQRN